MNSQFSSVVPLPSGGVGGRLFRWAAGVLCLLFATSCTWVKDDNDDCPEGFWLNLHYTYNILDVEAAPEYVKDATVYVYDTVGNYVTRIEAPLSALRANNHRVRVQGLTEGDYQFVVWSGAGSYSVSEDRYTIGDFRLFLPSAGGRLTDLFHGYVPLTHFDNDVAYASHDVNLTKDNNLLSCLVVPVGGEAEMAPEDYTMKLVTPNGTLDALGRLASIRQITYEPFERDTVTIDDAEYGRLRGIRFALSTLRLMADIDCRLILEKTETGETLFNVSLTEYLAMVGSLYTSNGRQLSMQEYLDRQDFYTIVFFLSGDNLDQLMQLTVNSWRLRANGSVKL